MSAFAAVHPYAAPKPHLRPVPDLPPEPPVTLTITVAGGGAGRDRVIEALRDLVVEVGVRVAIDDGPPEITLDPLARTAVRHGRKLELSRLEFDLLLFLARHPRQVFSRAQLLGQVWGHTHTTNRTVDVHVSRLRTKLDDPEVVTTVYGLGYRLADDAGVSVAERAGGGYAVGRADGLTAAELAGGGSTAVGRAGGLTAASVSVAER
ncbi:winged helix-turn-helix transcriptional regulator [Actinoplanes sp. TBRC 11911]|uniref:winged helix-turn-helix domain-containing protein n=1 Tax=Actinoplanes sp. TBRC 11911 TaxID=2729386 RepID=UPI00145D076B|nr:winged helix-turn-helix domain-containing protein [Actinoplanes sp. TBRC 11911]NMO51113.1 winged helix-turn-helix transcriptional regulator [Actinoplanes sp. TBRC 11911]